MVDDNEATRGIDREIVEKQSQLTVKKIRSRVAPLQWGLVALHRERDRLLQINRTRNRSKAPLPDSKDG